jgi:hypothetical protein
MSIRNTKKPLYRIWHNNAEDSPLGMMMGNDEEGAHVTVPPPLGSCTTKSKGHGFTFFVKYDQRRSTEEASIGVPMWHFTAHGFIAKGMRRGTVHPRVGFVTKLTR